MGGTSLSSLQKQSRPAPVAQAAPMHSPPNVQYTTKEMLAFYDPKSEPIPELEEKLQEHGLNAPASAEQSMGGIAVQKLEKSMKAMREQAHAQAQQMSSSNRFDGGRSLFGTSQQPVGEMSDSPKRGSEVVEALRPSENAFKAQRNANLDDTTKVVKKVNGILNKLTPEKYDTLSTQLLDPSLEILVNNEYMKKTIELIFARAVSQVSFCMMYADLARRLCDEEVQQAEGTQKKSMFRRVLVGVVQAEFEKQDKRDTDEEKEASKKRRLGNIQFIGELYNKALLSDNVIIGVIEKLLYGATPKPSDGAAFRPEAESLEEMCRLLITCGKLVDQKARLSRGDGASRLTEPKLKEFYGQIATLSCDSCYKPRIKITLVNMMDLRSQGWPVKVQTAKKIDDLEKENEEKERRKLEGIKHSSHTGEQTVWGKAAEVNNALASIKVGGDKKKKPAGKKGNDAGFTAVAAKKAAGKSQAQNNQGKKNQPVMGNGFEALGSNSSPKDKSKGKRASKEEKDKKDKKDKKESKDKDKKEEKEEKPMPPTDIPQSFRQMVVSRAQECMRAVEESERPAVMKEDFKDYEKVKHDDDTLLEDPQVLAVHEIMRKITMLKEQEERDELVQYMKELSEVELLTRADLNRGVAWFLATAGIKRLVDDTPYTYKRLMEVLVELMDFSMFVKTLQTACKGMKQWLSEMDEDDKLVDDVVELYDELCDKAFKLFMKSAEMGDTTADKILTLVNSMNHKANWPTLLDETTFFQVMVEELLTAEWVSNEQLSSFYEKMKEEAKSRNKVSIQVLSTMVEGAEAEAEEEEGEEANGEDAQEEEEEQA